MKARLQDGVIEIIPTNIKEKEFLQRIVGMRFDPVTAITTEEGGIIMTDFIKLRLFCQLVNNGTEFDNVSIEQ